MHKTYTDEELEAVRLRTLEMDKTSPLAASAEYEAQDRRLTVALKNGIVLLIPIDLIPGLRGAPDEALADVVIAGNGHALHWDAVDVQVTTGWLVAGIYGNWKWMESVVSEWERHNPDDGAGVS